MNLIPVRSRTYFALRKARESLLEYPIHVFPISVVKLYEMRGWGLMSDEQAASIYPGPSLLRPGMDAVTRRCRRTGVYITIFDSHLSDGRLRWTLAHEIGHIELDHLRLVRDLGRDVTLNEYKILEREADKFASEFLAPTAVLTAMGIRNPKMIAFLCGMSKEASDIRSRELKRYADRPVSLEQSKELEEQFHAFVQFVKASLKDNPSVRSRPFQTSEKQAKGWGT